MTHYIPFQQQQQAADCATPSIAADYFHPPVRQDTVLDMSVRKLYAIKQTQRSTHRQANLLKTVLVYNVFKAAVSPPEAPREAEHYTTGGGLASEGMADNNSCDYSEAVTVNAPPQMHQCRESGGFDMDVDEGGAAAAEQSWFDHCIDRMLTEDAEQPAFSLSDDDDDEDEVDDMDQYDAGHGPTIVTTEAMTLFEPDPAERDTSDDPAVCMLKRNRQSTSFNSLCTLGNPESTAGQQGVEIDGGVSECDRWQRQSPHEQPGVQSHHWEHVHLFASQSGSPGQHTCNLHLLTGM